MPSETLDRRVRRTRTLLRDALFALIEEKGYSAITIQDITDRADLNRVTFYFHYKDKDDLLIQVIQEMYDDLAKTQITAQSLVEWTHQDALLSFRHIQQHHRLYKVLLSEKGALSLVGRLIDYFAQHALEHTTRYLPSHHELPISLEMVEHFYAGAFVALARWWVLNDMPYSPEKMAEIATHLEVNSSQWILEWKNTESG
jgi:AcrR family transcriptional regulator